LIFKAIIFQLVLAFFLVGCQSNNIPQTNTEQVNTNVVNTTQKLETPEQTYNRFVEHYAKEIKTLDAAGQGSIKVCEMKSYNSSMDISYSNEFGKRIVLSVYDEYIVNSVSMYLDKKQANEFLVFIQNALKQSQKNPNLEKLNLGRFAVEKGWVIFTSRHGKISSFWGNDWVDRVLTSIKPEEIFGCITYVEPHL
jgi:hypothetical protein